MFTADEDAAASDLNSPGSASEAMAAAVVPAVATSAASASGTKVSEFETTL